MICELHLKRAIFLKASNNKENSVKWFSLGGAAKAERWNNDA